MGLESKFMHTEETMGMIYENEHNSLIRISSQGFHVNSVHPHEM